MFRKVTNLLLVFIGALTCTLGLISPVSALEAGDIVMQVRPAGQEIDLVPGEPYTGSVTVANIGRLPFNFIVSARPYQVLNDSYDPDFTTENDYTKLCNWISFTETEYHLEAGESTEVDFTIEVPDDVPGGGQYAAVMVETSDSKDANATMQTISQLASLLYAHVDGEQHVGGVIMTQSLPRFLLGSPFTSTVTVKNDGNVDFRFNHTLTIRDFFTNREVFTPDAVDLDGQPLGTANLIVLPTTSRTSKLTWDGAPQLGVFRAISQVTFLDQDSTKEQIVFICPVWLAGIVVFFIILMILWVVLRIRRRKQNKPLV